MECAPQPWTVARRGKFSGNAPGGTNNSDLEEVWSEGMMIIGLTVVSLYRICYVFSLIGVYSQIAHFVGHRR